MSFIEAEEESPNNRVSYFLRHLTVRDSLTHQTRISAIYNYFKIVWALRAAKYCSGTPGGIFLII